jgi:hypothetical protein
MTTITLRQWGLAALSILVFSACRKDSATQQSPESGSSSDLVLTPAGYMPRSNVHFLAPGNRLAVSNGHLQQMEIHSGKVIQDFGEVTVTPHRHSTEVQGWIAYAWWANTGSPITQFTTDWIVPGTPANQGNQTLFLFNGMQDGTARTSYIIQPVLQWGPSAAGGGKFWSVTNWYVSSKHAFFGTLVNVSSGTALRGVLKETAVAGTKFSYNSSFKGMPASSALQVDSVPQAFWAAETLESYGVTTPATMYPPDAGISMHGIQILQGATNATLSWSPAQAVAGSAQRAVVVSDASPGGQVNILFR